MTSAAASPGLVRAIGRWSLTALAINTIIGSGIFGLPDDIARRVGPAAPLAYIIAALGIGVVMGCFAEVASQFPQSGGPYLYARAAFGRFAAIEMGWLAWLVRVTAAAANANLFVASLGLLFPQSSQPLIRAALLATLAVVLGVVNIRGVKSGTRMSDVVAVAKLLPIALFVASGLFLVGGNIHVGASDAPGNEWLQAILALVFAYGGFEAALMPMAEVKDSARDAPFALFTALGIVVVTYLLVHLVVMGAFPGPGGIRAAGGARTARRRGGARVPRAGRRGADHDRHSHLDVRQPGGQLHRVAAADVCVRRAGRLSALPCRRPSALPHAVRLGHRSRHRGRRARDRGQLHLQRDPLVGGAAVPYGLVCAAVPVLRRRTPDAPAFRLPGGIIVPALGLSFCVVIAMYMDRSQMWIIGVLVLAAAVHWMVVRRRPSAAIDGVAAMWSRCCLSAR